MNVEDEWVTLSLFIVGWVDEDAILFEAVWTIPCHCFDLTLFHRGQCGVEIGEAARLPLADTHCVEFGGAMALCTAKDDRAVCCHDRRSGMDVSEIESLCGAVERLEPERACRQIAAADQDRLAAGQPGHALQVTVDLRGHVDCFALANGFYEDASWLEECLNTACLSERQVATVG